MKRKKIVRHHHSYQWKHIHHEERPIRWLPVDSRFFTPVLRFGNVKGVERLFLELEITLAMFVVMGTFVVAALRILVLFAK